MRKTLLISILFILGTLSFASIYPNDADIGIITNAEKGSIEEFFLTSVKSEYSLSWLEKYVDKSVLNIFNISYSKELSEIFPLKNPIISEIKGNRIFIKDLETKKIISYALSENNLIIALGIGEY